MSEPTAALMPHKKGIDICNDLDGSHYYIIRSDLHCYLKCSIHVDYQPNYEPQQYEIFPLHPACAWGDHYTCGPDGFNIIKGNNFITVNDLTAPKHMSLNCQKLSEDCQDGNHYLYNGTDYFIIKGNQVICTPSLTGPSTSTGTLDPTFQNGLYFYAELGGIGVLAALIDEDEQNWGIVDWVTPSLFDSSNADKYFVYPDLLDFLPGGLSITYGIASPRWELLKCFINTSNTALEWKESISKTVGYNKSEFNSLETNWSVTTEVSMGTSFSAGFLVQAAIEMQFSLSSTFGGANIQTSQEDWSEEHTTTEEVLIHVEAGQTVYLWQYRLGFAGAARNLLSCRDIAITNDNKPPSNSPLPPMNVPPPPLPPMNVPAPP